MSPRLGDAFERFEQAGREAREAIEATPRFRDGPKHRAQAYVSLVEARAMAYNFVVAPRLDHPSLHGQSTWHSTFYSLGQNCGDFRYGALLLDGGRSYRLRGDVGAMKLGLIQVHSHVMGHPDGEEIGNHDLVELAADDGTFDVVLSASARDDGIRLNEGSLNFLLVRRIYASIADEPGEIRVERDGGETVPETDPEAVAERLDRAAEMLRFLVHEWCIGLYELYIKAAGGKNRVAHVPGQELASNAAGSPSTTYGLCVYELEPDQALIVEWDPPESAYWAMQLGDVWSNALDFTSYQTDLNMTTAALDDDGRMRAVLCEEDPGFANWMDTRGRREGTFVSRNYRAVGESAPPALRVVSMEDVGRELSGSPAISPSERERSLTDRRERFRVAYGD